MIEPNKQSLNIHNLSLKFWFYRYFLSGLDTYYNKFITWIYIYVYIEDYVVLYQRIDTEYFNIFIYPYIEIYGR